MWVYTSLSICLSFKDKVSSQDLKSAKPNLSTGLLCSFLGGIYIQLFQLTLLEEKAKRPISQDHKAIWDFYNNLLARLRTQS